MSLYLGLLAPALIILMPGLVIHLFIIAVNVNDWLKGRSVTPVDHIITSLGISRMCFQCAATLHLFVFTIFLNKPYAHATLVIIRAFFSFFNYANIWLTSLLSIVFCLKISSIRTRLFLYLKGMIEQRTAYFIVASGLFSALNCLLLMMSAIKELTRDGTYNTTRYILQRECNFINHVYNYTIAIYIALLFYCISSVLLFSSLYHHTRRMKMSGNVSINLETYYSAMKFVSVTFIFNTTYFTCYFVAVFYYFLHCVNLLWLYIILAFLPVLHSSYLIYRTAKLRSQMSKVLQNVTDFLFQRKDQETRENIDIVAE